MQSHAIFLQGKTVRKKMKTKPAWRYHSIIWLIEFWRKRRSCFPLVTPCSTLCRPSVDCLHNLSEAGNSFHHTKKNVWVQFFYWFGLLCRNSLLVFDSRIVRRTVCESMRSRVQKLLQWVVALENQHAIRAVCKGTPTRLIDYTSQFEPTVYSN